MNRWQDIFPALQGTYSSAYSVGRVGEGMALSGLLPNTNLVYQNHVQSWEVLLSRTRHLPPNLKLLEYSSHQSELLATHQVLPLGMLWPRNDDTGTKPSYKISTDRIERSPNASSHRETPSSGQQSPSSEFLWGQTDARLLWKRAGWGKLKRAYIRRSTCKLEDGTPNQDMETRALRAW